MSRARQRSEWCAPKRGHCESTYLDVQSVQNIWDALNVVELNVNDGAHHLQAAHNSMLEEITNTHTKSNHEHAEEYIHT